VFTQEQMVAIVAKRNATRELRGTKGRKQKKNIKGVVPSEVVAGAPTAASEPGASTQGVTTEGSVEPVAAPTSGEPGKE
jgi:hypothetical protein